MHEKRYGREIERLRDPERVARLEVNRVIDLILNHYNGITSVLDVGTGSGLFAEAFALKKLQVTGVDANPEMVKASSHFVPSGTFQEAIAEKLPFHDRSFDVVFMGLVLHETDKTLAAVQEAFRVSRSGLAILEWPYETGPIGPPLEHRLSSENITTLAQSAGFVDQKLIQLEFLSLYLLTHQGMAHPA
jgi:ubiquinone/menaquinone biosynthesis C-methylase UbiE